MPLVTARDSVLSTYGEAASHGWTVPTFCAENLTTLEAVLSAAIEHADKLGIENLPVTLAITNLYSHRQQTVNYTHTRRWDIGIRLFLADLDVLTSECSLFDKLRVMVHLDHVQPDDDAQLLGWDMGQFSSIMYDASALPFERNIELTAAFVARHGSEIVVEGACDEIMDATGNERSDLTTPERAAEYIQKTGADFIVANLGTEHRASASELQYHGELAREIRERIGHRIVLHGCSSVSNDQVADLFDDGVAKVNIWTILERDSSPALLEDMARNAAKVAGPNTARRLLEQDLLGQNSDVESRADLGYFTTCYRQQIIFDRMKRIARSYFELWYR